MKVLITTTVLLFWIHCSWAQHKHVPVFPTESGTTLLNQLVSTYKPTGLLTYGTARDFMFANIYDEGNDTIECIYTGFKRYLNPALDPTTTMSDNGSSNSINTEHAFPRSKGASTAGEADLHHLFPTKATVNTARGSLKFGITNDNLVDKWYINNQALNNAPPSADRYRYSEVVYNDRFEPRDEVKGNIARAVFYYYTMYKSVADAADPNFFNTQVSALCQWHIDDPVDSLEWERTYRIAQLQQNKANPFVLDCTLAQRSYCSSIVCTPPVSINKIASPSIIGLKNYPNPFGQITTISYQLAEAQDMVTIAIYNAMGQVIKTWHNTAQLAGQHMIEFEQRDLANGIYFCKVSIIKDAQTTTFSKAMILSK